MLFESRLDLQGDFVQVLTYLDIYLIWQWVVYFRTITTITAISDSVKWQLVTITISLQFDVCDLNWDEKLRRPRIEIIDQQLFLVYGCLSLLN